MLASRVVRLAVGVSLVALCVAGPVRVATAAGPGNNPADKFLGGNAIVINADETIPHDLYVSGGTVRIAGRINGDLFVFGGNVDVSGPVSGDLFIAGGTVNVESSVDRHLRIIGGDVTIGGSVKQDVLAAAGTLNVTSGAHLGGDLIFGAGKTQMDGTVDGSVLGSAQSYASNGRVGGTEQVTLRQERESRRPQPLTAAERILEQARAFIGIALAGVLLILVVPSFIRRGAQSIEQRPWPSLGVGAAIFLSYFAIMVALLVAMIVLAIPLAALGFEALVATVVIGSLLAMGVLTFAFVLVMLFIAGAVAGLAVGRLIFRQIPAPWAQNDYVPLLVGAAIVVIVTALPFIGGIVNFLVILFGLGALAFALWGGRPADTSVAA
jgi:hypothetical protein